MAFKDRAEAGVSTVNTLPKSVQVSFGLVSPQRPEQRLQWLKVLREHLNARVVPVSTAHGVETSARSLQDAVIVAITTTPTQTNIGSVPASSSPARPGALPLDSEIVSVGKVQEAKKSFRACLHPIHLSRAESSENELAQRSVVLVAMLTSGNREMGLVIKDSTGEIPCEVILPMKSINCIVLLKEWNLICSSVYGNYLEIEALVYVSQTCTLTSQPSLQWPRQSSHSVADVQTHLKGDKVLKGVTVTGRLEAVSEPIKNGPDFMLILRLTHTSDDSKYCHLITQSRELMHLARVLKLFSVYIFTGLKSVIMNKGKEDEMAVLTTTADSGVEYVPANQEPLSLSGTTGSQRREDLEVVSPLRKKLRSGESHACAGEANGEECAPHPVHHVPRNNALLSYKGVITRCLLPEAGVYELDNRLALYLTHSNLSNQGRGLRKGAEVEVINAHLLKISTPPFKQLSGFVCCSVSRVEVVCFSKKNTPFKAFVSQNKLAHMLSKFSAMDVAWLTLVFLSLLKKFKRKEAFNVMADLCAMVGVGNIHHSPHSSFLQVPHHCQLLDPVNLSHRPLLPSLQYILQTSKEKVTSALFCWRGSKEGGGAGVSSSLTESTCLLSVAVRAIWSFGVIKSTDYPNPQLFIGTLRGNRSSGYLELLDGTASIPLLVCVPYHSPNDSTSHWLLKARNGCQLALKEFWVIVEKTEESERTKNTKFNFYLHSHNIDILAQEKSHTDSGSYQDSKEKKSASVAPSALYVCIKSKNCLKLQGHAADTSECGFEAQGLAHSNLEVLQKMTSDTATSPVSIAVGFTSACYYSYLHNGCIYRLSCSQDSSKVLPSLKKLLKEPYITVSDRVLLEMVALPRVPGPGRCVPHTTRSHLLEIGELISMFYLPKLPTIHATKNDPCSRSNGGLVSFQGLIKEHSYRIDCASAPGESTTSLPHSRSHTMRHIIALCLRGIHCPNTIMVYCKYTSQESLPLGLLPGSVASFHFFSLKSSTRSGNMYCVNCSSSSITVESVDEVGVTELECSDARNKWCDLTQEMVRLPVTHLYDLTQRLLRGRLSREIVHVRATVMAVQHAFIQFQCQACQCTMVDGVCRTTCPAKRATLNTDARFLVQDGTGEAHLYVKDRVLPIVLGMMEREWSDLLDLIYKVGQVTYTKSNTFKGERSSRAVTTKEKAEGMFLDILTRPSLVRTSTIYCQPFLSSSELQHPLGQRSYRVCLRHSIDYVTLSLPRLQLRALALSPTEPLSHSHQLLAKLELPHSAV